MLARHNADLPSFFTVFLAVPSVRVGEGVYKQVKDTVYVGIGYIWLVGVLLCACLRPPALGAVNAGRMNVIC